MHKLLAAWAVSLIALLPCVVEGHLLGQVGAQGGVHGGSRELLVVRARDGDVVECTVVVFEAVVPAGVGLHHAAEVVGRVEGQCHLNDDGLEEGRVALQHGLCGVDEALEGGALFSQRDVGLRHGHEAGGEEAVSVERQLGFVGHCKEI